MVYPALLPLMRTLRLPVIDRTYAPADLNGLVRFAERRNLVSARVPSHFKRSVLVSVVGRDSVVSIATRNGLDGPGIQLRFEIFRTRPDRPWGLLSPLYNGYEVFTGSKAAEA